MAHIHTLIQTFVHTFARWLLVIWMIFFLKEKVLDARFFRSHEGQKTTGNKLTLCF